jgi:hypothetical protein
MTSPNPDQSTAEIPEAQIAAILGIVLETDSLTCYESKETGY